MSRTRSLNAFLESLDKVTPLSSEGDVREAERLGFAGGQAPFGGTEARLSPRNEGSGRCRSASVGVGRRRVQRILSHAGALHVASQFLC